MMKIMLLTMSRMARYITCNTINCLHFLYFAQRIHASVQWLLWQFLAELH